MNKDFFKNKAPSYDQVNHRVTNVANIADSMLNHIHFESDMSIMDFGSGTGLLLARIAPVVARICAVDISKSMNEQLAKKQASLSCELEIIEIDLSKSSLDRKFDGIISSMTMHHVDDIKTMFDKFHAMLTNGGFIAIADLEPEDGSFHSEDTGVFHCGFEREQLLNVVKNSGFNNIEITTVSIVHKPQGDYPVFLLTATA